MSLVKLIPSKYQEAVYDETENTSNSIIINATAGSGKSTTLLELTHRLPKHKDIIYMAFNKDIVEAMRLKTPEHVRVSTIHSFGASVLYRSFPGIKMDENKIFSAAIRLFKTKWYNEVQEKAYFYCYRITRLVELMCLTLTIDDDKVEDLANEYDIMIVGNEIEHAIELFDNTYKNIERMCFTDMVFQVAIRNLKMPKYDFVLVDEIQDLNAAQQRIVQKIIKPGKGRLIGVGDSDQAIYGFAGSDHESYQKMKTLVPNTVQLPLSMCYRCPVESVKLAQTIVPSIEWRPGAPKGIVNYDGKLNDMQSGDVGICRNTRPLVEIFRGLIKQGKKATIRGREIGASIISLIKKTRGKTIEQVLQKTAIIRLELREKLFKKRFARPDEHPQMLKLTEKIEIIKILSEGTGTVLQLIKKIEGIFVDDQTEGIILSTIHRFKGGEADRIFFINRHLIPSKYAVTAKEMKQETNLLFIAYTRNKKELHFINV